MSIQWSVEPPWSAIQDPKDARLGSKLNQKELCEIWESSAGTENWWSWTGERAWGPELRGLEKGQKAKRDGYGDGGAGQGFLPSSVDGRWPPRSSACRVGSLDGCHPTCSPLSHPVAPAATAIPACFIHPSLSSTSSKCTLPKKLGGFSWLVGLRCILFLDTIGICLFQQLKNIIRVQLQPLVSQ